MQLINTKNFPAGTKEYFTHGTLVRFFSSMSSHMHNQHVLSFKRFFFSRAFFPTANKTFFVSVYMIVVDMFYEIILEE
jgi:hypothetical protein